MTHEHRSQPQLVYGYGHTSVEIFDGWVRTSLPDGTRVDAQPRHGAEDVARAEALGYGGDVWAMTRDHDRFHALLAHMLGLKESPALRQASSVQTSELAGLEECAVLAIQAFSNGCRREGLL